MSKFLARLPDAPVPPISPARGCKPIQSVSRERANAPLNADGGGMCSSRHRQWPRSSSDWEFLVYHRHEVARRVELIRDSLRWRK